MDAPQFPEAYKIQSQAQIDVFEALKASGSSTDWFYVSPATGFGAYAPGERTGNFRIGGNILLSDADGTSFISGADYAIAFVNGIEEPTHHREGFGVAY